MTGSAAEERLRAKVEASLRRRYPDARIVHELVLRQGGVRIDVAAVDRDRLVVAEIKSERDSLKRLGSQIRQAVAVATDVWVCFANKHVEAMRHRLSHYTWAPDRMTSALNPDHIAELNHCSLMLEQDDGLLCWPDGRRPALPDPRQQLDALWRDELGRLCRQITGHDPGTRPACIRGILEHGTGSQIRRGVCDAIRGRPFPRADQLAA